MGNHIRYKLGLDLGSTSLGWAVLELNDTDEIIALHDLGVRIFPDGRDSKHAPINVGRRIARGMRRRSDRVKMRVQRTLKLLEKYNLQFQNNKDTENPYKLRAEALDRKLKSNELGRVLFHLALRRGFKSNRKDLKKEGGGKLKMATEKLQSQIAGFRTLGEWLYKNNRARFNLDFAGAGNKLGDDALYPTRDMYIEEFNKISAAQKLPNEMRDEFYKAIFFQRDLLPQEVGNCIFEEGEPRAFRFDPAFQKWRALQQLNQLKILENGKSIDLTDDQIAKIKQIMFASFDGVKNGKITFAELKKQLDMPARTTKFNLESDIRKDIDADHTAFAFHKIGADKFCTRETINKINGNELDDGKLIDWLVDRGASTDLAEQIANIDLEEGTANVSLKAINKMMPFLEQGQIYSDACESSGYHHSDFNAKIPMLDELPYYGDIAVLRSSLIYRKGLDQFMTTNTTVHIAMNQIRAVVNELIRKYGKPQTINVEMGRDLRSGAKELDDMMRAHSKNKKENDEIAEKLIGIGVRPNHENILKYKLWERLAAKPQDRKCVYTGQYITSITELYKSGKFEIEHILPYAQTLDDSIANKTISSIDANRFKGNRTPAEAFSAADSPWKYGDVWARAQSLPMTSRWRFKQDAMDDFNKNGDCIARALNDTRHMSRLAVLYLKHISADKNKVFGLPGQMTALFRDMWSLNWWKNKDESEKEKYRAHHIHHAIDAFVIACMNQGNYEKLSDNAARLESMAGYYGKDLKEKRKELFSDINLPFAGFNHHEFYEKCENTLISYRPNKKDPHANGTIGQLHEDTAYSLAKINGIKGRFSCMESVATMKEKDFQYLNPKTLEMFLHDAGVQNDDPNIFAKFMTWCSEEVDGHKRAVKVRMIDNWKDTAAYIPIFRMKQERDECRKAYLDWYIQDGIASGITDKIKKKEQQKKESELLDAYQNAAKKAYKWFVNGNNFCADVFEIRDDDKRYPKLRGKWQTEIMSNYNAQLDNGEPMWHEKYPTARRVMRLKINDIVRAEFSRDEKKPPKGLIDAINHKCDLERKDTIEMNLRVKKISSDGKIYLRPDWVAKEDQDKKSWHARATSLQNHKARQVFVSPTGKMSE